MTVAALTKPLSKTNVSVGIQGPTLANNYVRGAHDAGDQNLRRHSVANLRANERSK